MSLGAIVEDAVQQLAVMKAAGLPLAERLKSLETLLRDVWPKPRDGRTEPWRYLCDTCRDTGLELHECAGTNGICGRVKAHGAHEFGRPCWCDKGAAFKVKTRTPDDAVLAAAKTAKPPTRWGTR